MLAFYPIYLIWVKPLSRMPSKKSAKPLEPKGQKRITYFLPWML